MGKARPKIQKDADFSEYGKNHYVYDVYFKPTAIDYTFLKKTSNLKSNTSLVRSVAYSEHAYDTKEWEHDIVNTFLDNFEGTDMSEVKDLIYV